MHRAKLKANNQAFRDTKKSPQNSMYITTDSKLTHGFASISLNIILN